MFIKKIAVAAAAVVLLSLSAPTVGAYAAEAGVALQDSKEIVTTYELDQAGDEVDFCFLGAPSNWRSTYQWESSHPEVAVVDQNGVVTAVSTGSTVITIRCGAEYVQMVTVTVYDMDITIGTAGNKVMTTLALKTGSTLDLNFYGVRDWTARKSNYLVEWYSSKSDVVSVNELNGIVEAKKEGTAMITFYLYDMEKDVLFTSASVTVVVTEATK